MQKGEWPPEYEVIVRSRLIDPPSLGEMDPDLNLPGAGLDSLETISLIVELEETFAITLPDSMLSMETFSSPARLWNSIQSCRGG